jgi:hypothetical protein
MVMHLVLPQGQPTDVSNDIQLQQLQQQIQDAAQAVLDAYPADCSLLSALLQPVTAAAATAAALPVTMPAGTVLAASSSTDYGAAAGGASSLVTAVEGVHVHPVALALPETSASSSMGSSTAADASTAVTVCIAQHTVSQLLQAGQRSVRVVVTSQQPGAPPLADQTWQPPTSAEAAPEDLCLPLQLQLSDAQCLLPQQQQPVALSVVVLAGSRQDNNVHIAAPSGLAAAAAEPDAAMRIDSVHAPAAALAKLPLLVLPAGGAAELQQLHAGLTSEGLQPAAAYQEILPLLQDLAVILSSNSSSSIATHVQGDTGAPQQQQQHGGPHMLHVVRCALLECFEAQGLANCTELLSFADTAAQAAAVEGTQSSAASSPAAEVATAAAAADGGSGVSCSAAAAAGDTGNLSCRSMQSETASCAAVSSSSRVVDTGKPTCSTSSSSTSDSQEATGAAAAAARHQQQQQLSGQQSIDAGALSVCYETLLWGFPAAVEPMYLSFKAAALRSTDFLSVLSYGVGLTATAIKLMCSVTDRHEMRIMVLQAGFLLIHAITHVVVWAAGTGAPQLIALQQWRNTVLAGSASLAICMFAATSVRGGVWAAASLAHQLGDKPGMLYWVFVVYRHVMQPLRLRIGLLPSLLLAAEYTALDHLYMKPQLPWLGTVGTALLMVAVHLALAARLELGMRRSVVRSL